MSEQDYGMEWDVMNRELVQALVLDDTENLGYVFAMGDMNYRINMAPEDVGLYSLMMTK